MKKLGLLVGLLVAACLLPDVAVAQPVPPCQTVRVVTRARQNRTFADVFFATVRGTRLTSEACQTIPLLQVGALRPRVSCVFNTRRMDLDLAVLVALRSLSGASRVLTFVERADELAELRVFCDDREVEAVPTPSATADGLPGFRLVLSQPPAASPPTLVVPSAPSPNASCENLEIQAQAAQANSLPVIEAQNTTGERCTPQESNPPLQNCSLRVTEDLATWRFRLVSQPYGLPPGTPVRRMIMRLGLENLQVIRAFCDGRRVVVISHEHGEFSVDPTRSPLASSSETRTP
ncbi:MAG: hypothetical protein WCV84_03560 [Patescibacteria group bacterium]